MELERDFDKNPYTEHERRVCDYILQISGDSVGCGSDPIGFLIASHNYQNVLLREAQARVRQLEGGEVEVGLRSDYDDKGDVLALTLNSLDDGVVGCILDEHEIFVFRRAGNVIGFSIPHFCTYWRPRQEELVAHLCSYGVEWPDLRRVLLMSGMLNGGPGETGPG